jgi:hypothetical protein
LSYNIHCRMKYGDSEFEIEGTVSEDLSKKIDYMYECFRKIVDGSKVPPRSERKASEKQQESKQKSNRHTGKKVSFYRTNIQRIIDEAPEWMVEKSTSDVVTKLKTEYGVPGADDNGVKVNLIRFFRKGLLTRKEVDGRYLYSVPQLKK